MVNEARVFHLYASFPPRLFLEMYYFEIIQFAGRCKETHRRLAPPRAATSWIHVAPVSPRLCRCLPSALFFPPFLAAPPHMEFPGQASDLSHSCDLHCSYSKCPCARPDPSAAETPLVPLHRNGNSMSLLINLEQSPCPLFAS